MRKWALGMVWILTFLADGNDGMTKEFVFFYFAAEIVAPSTLGAREFSNH